MRIRYDDVRGTYYVRLEAQGSPHAEAIDSRGRSVVVMTIGEGRSPLQAKQSALLELAHLSRELIGGLND